MAILDSRCSANPAARGPAVPDRHSLADLFAAVVVLPGAAPAWLRTRARLLSSPEPKTDGVSGLGDDAHRAVRNPGCRFAPSSSWRHE